VNEPDAPETPGADDLRTLYGAASQPTPPAALGEQLRQAARDAVQAPTRQQAWRWRQGVAVAALVVLSVTILLLLPREQLHLPGEAPLQAPPASDAPLPAARPALELPESPAPAAESKRQAVGKSRQEAPPATAPRLRQAPAEQPAPGRSAADAASNLRRDSAGSSSTFAEEAQQPGDAEDSGVGSDVLEESYYRSSPELWISHIERLLSEGRFADARREFDAFQASHPQHPYAARR